MAAEYGRIGDIILIASDDTRLFGPFSFLISFRLSLVLERYDSGQDSTPIFY